MSVYALGHFLIYCIINALTPGPGNILALNTVTNYGWKKGRPLFFGIFAGYYVVQILCALFLYSVGTFLPAFLDILKYIGAAYILWLAYRIAVSPLPDENTAKSSSFMKGFMLQFVNVKIYLFGITALTGFIVQWSNDLHVILLVEIAIATLGTIATSIWILAGALLQTFYVKHFKIINIILALTLLECVYSMFAG